MDAFAKEKLSNFNFSFFVGINIFVGWMGGCSSTDLRLFSTPRLIIIIIFYFHTSLATWRFHVNDQLSSFWIIQRTNLRIDQKLRNYKIYDWSTGRNLFGILRSIICCRNRWEYKENKEKKQASKLSKSEKNYLRIFKDWNVRIIFCKKNKEEFGYFNSFFATDYWRQCMRKILK